jgi:hypothetical protein
MELLHPDADGWPPCGVVFPEAGALFTGGLISMASASRRENDRRRTARNKGKTLGADQQAGRRRE